MAGASRIARIVAVVVAVATVSPGCGVVERRRAERDRISRAVQKAVDAGSGRYTVSIQWKRRPRKDADIATPRPLALDGVVDLERNRALAYLPGAPLTPIALYDNTRTYVPLAREGITSIGLEFDDRRLSSLGGEDALGFLWLNPAYLYRFASGAVVDTLKQVGTAGADGTTQYRGGVDRDSAIRNKLENLQVAVINELRAMNVRDFSFKDCRFWIDAEGRLRRFTITMPQAVDPDNVFDATFRIDLLDVGAPVDIPKPDKAEKVQGFSSLTNAVKPLLA